MSLAEISIRRPIFITCVVLLTLVLGFTSLMRMSVDLFPDVTFPVLFVQTVYPGASPVDMEKLVSKQIEDELGSLSGLNRLTSTNAESVSTVVMEFKLGTDIKEREQQVRQRIGNIRRQLPEEIEEPIIRRFDPADQAVVRVAVLSEMAPAKLYDLVDENVKAQFDTLSGVGLVSISGGRKREIQVHVDMQKLQERKLSLTQIADRIRATSKDVPIGKVESNGKEVVIRASGEFTSLEALRKVNVSFFGSDQVVRLDSIARVEEGLVDEVSRTSLMSNQNQFKRSPALFVDVFKQSGANTVRVVDAALKQLDKTNAYLKQKGLPVEVQLVRESAKPIRLNIADVRESIVIGILLCIIVVFFFLGSGRSTFITGMALPNSLLGGFILMAAMGFTLNIMTLLALSLAVGLLIDDAIVVRENIFRHLEMGKSPREAALIGTQEVALAVIATTMVVIAVFGPIAFLDGIIGQFFKQFGLTVVFTMLISLFDAFTVAPMLSAYMAAPVHKTADGKKTWMQGVLDGFNRFQDRLEKIYSRLLIWTLAHPKAVLGGALALFVLSLVAAGKVPKNFLPAADTGEFVIYLELPQGSTMESTEKISRQVEEQVRKYPGIDLISTVIGSTSGLSSPHTASVYVRLLPKKQRNQVTSAVRAALREELSSITGAMISFGEIDIGGGNQKQFILNLVGDNLEELAAYADKIAKKLKASPDLVDVDLNYRTGKPEYHVLFQRGQAESLGVSTVVAGSELRARVEGIVPTVYRESGKEYDIRLRLSEEDRDIRKVFNQTLIPNVNFNMIPLSKVAKGQETLGFSQINRQNKSRYISVTANISPKGSLGSATTTVQKLLTEDAEYKTPTGVSYAFQGQAEDFQELMANMLVALGLGVLFIYLVLASLYESFITPFTILLALPLAMMGAFFALLWTGKSLDIFSMIGFILLMGVVAKNSILLVDYTQQLIDQGVELKAALLKACVVRLRPILMTSLALIAGTIPIAIGLNEASAQRTSMGVAIIGGLISSTFLTLVVVPAAYGYVDRFRQWVNRRFEGLFSLTK